ncbi:hypothetical protein AX16_006460 [Volvariella volvacea WC 439]|nr:hypothetical protein AX16_006460 [Volvariella volvacea WC 439]
MANVLPPQIEFQPRPVAHAPSPLAFGFGLHPSTVGWQSPATPGHHNPIPFQQLASAVSSPSVRAQKRRYEPDEEVESSRPTRDDAMDRSPTPERPRRTAPKRARVTLPGGQSKESTSKESKNREEGDVDVGVLLASLPPQSLLPILMALLNEHPSLKSAILPLIPRPTLETAVQALAHSAKKLRDAYPYSAPSSSLSFGFSQSTSVTATQHGSMRDSYVLSRLRPHIAEFMSACTSYLPYFSYLPRTVLSSLPNVGDGAYEDRSERVSTALQALQKDQSHPSETFILLSAISNHLFEQPALTQTALGNALLPRLTQEWKGWVDRVDEIVNRQGGMFGSDMVKGWERGLDEMARHRDEFRTIRDSWVTKVGWLVGRVFQQPMDE